jgi:hypothetical protein
MQRVAAGSHNVPTFPRGTIPGSVDGAARLNSSQQQLHNTARKGIFR